MADAGFQSVCAHVCSCEFVCLSVWGRGRQCENFPSNRFLLLSFT